MHGFRKRNHDCMIGFRKELGRFPSGAEVYYLLSPEDLGTGAKAKLVESQE
jgi:hypothetical protein